MDIRTYNRNNLGLIVLPLAGDMSYKYKYNGKEWQDELGLNFYDYGARNYDPALGRWMNMDFFSEKYYNISNYVYTLNNPVYFVDPDGRIVEPAKNKETADALKLMQNDPKQRAIYEKLNNSKTVYHINVASSFDKETYHQAGEDTTLGGSTSYSFKDNRVNILVNYDSENMAINVAALADEMKTGEQFEDNKIGFEKVGKYDSKVLAYDPIDEVETKIASVDALKANNMTVEQADPINKYQSTKVMKAIQSGETDTKKLIDVLMSTLYSQYFDVNKKYEQNQPNPKKDDAHKNK